MSTVADNNNTQSTGATSIGLDIRPIGGNIGAEVRGVKLSGDLQPATIKALHQAVLKHKVIFVRDQHHLDDATHRKPSAVCWAIWSAIPPFRRWTALPRSWM
jgi:alpha-ketoglutarate-dependent taurine dioxygenase